MTTTEETLNQELIDFLRQDQLDYPAGAEKFGSKILPLLQEIMKSNDENIATKAAYMAGYIKDDATIDLLIDAASNRIATVRIAAAIGARKLEPDKAAVVLAIVMEDNDAGVLKTAIQSLQDLKTTDQFKARLTSISTTHQDDVIRESALRLIKQKK